MAIYDNTYTTAEYRSVMTFTLFFSMICGFNFISFRFYLFFVFENELLAVAERKCNTFFNSPYSIYDNGLTLINETR